MHCLVFKSSGMAFLGGLKIAALHKTEELATSYCQDSYISFRFQKP